MIALLDHLGIDRADVVGFSVGGLRGYELVISYPDRVRRAVVASAGHRDDRGGEADPARLPTPDDFQAMRLLPRGQLAVLPGAAHMNLTRSTLLAPVIEAFLA